MGSRRLMLTIGLAFSSGYLSLSYEILWYRTFAFVTAGLSSIFALLLGLFLLGIAMGASRARRVCTEAGADRDVLLMRLAWLLLAANAVCIAIAPGLAFAAKVHWAPVLLLVIAGAGLMGSVLPVLAHFGIDPDDRAGWRISLVYVGNIVGSSLGSALTGFYLMDIFSTASLSVGLGVLGFIAAAAVTFLVPGDAGRRGRARVGLLALAGTVLLVAGKGALYDTLYERLLYKTAYEPTKRFKQLVENRHGVIAVGQDDRLFGGGAYDGAFNTTPAEHGNGIHRAYAVEAIRSQNDGAPQGRDVLMIGLASGSWAQVIANLPSTKTLTIIEINPGYLGLIRQYPMVRSLLENPKVKIEIDDGRRWLVRHPEARFDVSVLNTSFYWRAHSTNLLSADFLTLMKSRLRPWGIHYFNTTSSVDVMRTAAVSFPHALRVSNFVAVSDAPFAFDEPRWRKTVLEMRIDDVPVLDLTTGAGRIASEKLLRFGTSLDGGDPRAHDRLESRESMIARFGTTPIVTDDNMLGEVVQPLAFPGPP